MNTATETTPGQTSGPAPHATHPDPRIQRLLDMHAEGRLIRGLWQKTDERGRELACWAGAFGKEIDCPQLCPGDLIPQWFAFLLPVFDDHTSKAAHAGLQARFVEIMQQAHLLEAAAWQRAEFDAKIAALEVALGHDTANVVQPVIDLLKRARQGEDVKTLLSAAAAAADAARSHAAAAAAADAARSHAASDAAALAARWAADAASDAAALAARWAADAAADAARWAAAAAAAAARWAAWDQICSTTFHSLEAEIAASALSSARAADTAADQAVPA